MRPISQLNKICLAALALLTGAYGIDSEGDGMSDVWQDRWGITSEQALEDPDGDGVSNLEESRWKTNPLDGTEYPDFSLNLVEGAVAAAYRPVKAGQRIQFESTMDLVDWLSAGNELTAADADPADDGVDLLITTNGDARGFVRVVATELDADADGLTEWEESELNLSDTNGDWDGDGILDGDEFRLGLSASDPDEDGDGVPDGSEIYTHGTDPNDYDSDGDGLGDGWEIKYGLDPLVPDDPSVDADGDGLDARDEEGYGTDPYSADTDWDGIPDGDDQLNRLSPSPGELYLPTFTLTSRTIGSAVSAPDLNRPEGSSWGAGRMFHYRGPFEDSDRPQCAERPLPNRFMNHRHWWSGESDAIQGAYYGPPVGAPLIDLILAHPSATIMEETPHSRNVEAYTVDSFYQTAEHDLAVGSPSSPCALTTERRMRHQARTDRRRLVLETGAPARGSLNWLNYRRTKKEFENSKRQFPETGRLIEIQHENVEWRTFSGASGTRSDEYIADFTQHNGLDEEFSHFNLEPGAEPAFGKNDVSSYYFEQFTHFDHSFLPFQEIIFGDLILGPEGDYIDERENTWKDFEILGGDRFSETVIALAPSIRGTLGFRQRMTSIFHVTARDDTPTIDSLGGLSWSLDSAMGEITQLDESDVALTVPTVGASVTTIWDGKALWKYHLIEGPIFRPDWNRDGSIDEEDRIPSSRRLPFPLLPNTDSDRDGAAADNSDQIVNGEADLDDWIPVFLKLDEMLEEWPREQYDYKLAHSGGEFFGFLELEDVSPESIGDYLSQPAVIQGLEQSAHAITNVDGVALSPAWLEKARSGSAALLVELRGVTNRPLELRISKNGTPVARSLFFVGAEVRFVTPSGDPKSLPVSEGNGQNEFVFNDAYPGVLSLRLEAEVSGIASSIEAQPFRFEVESIGDSLLVWDNVNQGGEASIEGNRVTAHATFEGLPTENSAFGNKQARLFLGDALLAKQSFEVFFPKNGSNHPETESDPASNWFYYWSQEIDVPNLKYIGEDVPSLQNPDRFIAGQVPGIAEWRYTRRLTAEDKLLIRIFPQAARSGNPYDLAPYVSGIDHFFQTVHHEHKHVLQIAAADDIVGLHENTIWENGWSWNPSPFRHNGWAPGIDGKWGEPDCDDNFNGEDDDAAFNGGLFEPGYLAGESPTVDDEPLVHPDAATEPAARSWPAAWPLPDRYYPAIHAIEADAQIYAEERVEEGDFAHLDWSSPGKQRAKISE